MFKKKATGLLGQFTQSGPGINNNNFATSTGLGMAAAKSGPSPVKQVNPSIQGADLGTMQQAAQQAQQNNQSAGIDTPAGHSGCSTAAGYASTSSDATTNAATNAADEIGPVCQAS